MKDDTQKANPIQYKTLPPICVENKHSQAALWSCRLLVTYRYIISQDWLIIMDKSKNLLEPVSNIQAAWREGSESRMEKKIRLEEAHTLDGPLGYRCKYFKEIGGLEFERSLPSARVEV